MRIITILRLFSLFEPELSLTKVFLIGEPILIRNVVVLEIMHNVALKQNQVSEEQAPVHETCISCIKVSEDSNNRWKIKFVPSRWETGFCATKMLTVIAFCEQNTSELYNLDIIAN